MIEIKLIDRAHRADIRLKNEPFSLFGKMIPSYANGKWDHATEYFDTVSEMTFPDESYDFDEMSKNTSFLGAYDGDTCIGLAIMQEGFFKHMYLYDLKVAAAYRGKGVGTLLIEKAMALAKEKGYGGIYTIGQDNNLAACLFYIHAGFHIGGFDTDVYYGTSQAEKADILFYKR